MKQKTIRLFIVLIALQFLRLHGQQQEEIKEYVQVLNMEMVVRVMANGSPVAGLKKGDFTLQENGQPREINGFFEVRRRLVQPAQPTMPAANQEPIKKPGRLFLLFFWVYEPKVNPQEALEYFFRDVYRESDRVILATLNKAFFINTPADKETTLRQLQEELSVIGRMTLSERASQVRALHDFFQEYLVAMQFSSENRNVNLPVIARTTLITKYSSMLKEYRVANLTPHLSRLEDMAKSLEAIDADKWVLVFYQRDSLPVYDMEKLFQYATMVGIKTDDLSALQNEFARTQFELEFAQNVSSLTSNLRNRFIQANALFHLLMLDPRQTKVIDSAETHVPLSTLSTPFSSWEAVMRDISVTTGGQVMDGNRMKEALMKAANLEDIYYILTYKPAQEGSRNRKIDIRVNRPGVHIIHGRRLEMEKLPEIQIKKAEYVSGLLRLELENFYRIPKGSIPIGMVSVTVIGRETRGGVPQVWLEKEMETFGTVELALRQQKPGDFVLTVQVLDHLTGRQATAEFETQITELPQSTVEKSAYPVELRSILEKAAGYCEKLKRAAFHFICEENVTQDLLGRRVEHRESAYLFDRTTWRYDYQITFIKGTIKENRTLLRKNREKMNQPDAELETRFRSFFTFYMPVTLFSADKQENYIYRLEAWDKIKKRKVARIKIIPVNTETPMVSGLAWVDGENGSVLKIALDQKSLKGIEEIEKKAQEAGARLSVSDIHWYDVERRGIRFPNKTEIFEYYITSFKKADTRGLFTYQQNDSYAITRGTNQVELSRTYVNYSDYRFFSIEVGVEETIHNE